MNRQPKLVTLPGGGRAWCKTVLNHGEGRERRRLVSKLDAESLALMAKGGAEAASMADQIDPIMEGTVRIVVSRWEGVTDPDDGHALGFPNEIDRMDDADFQALYQACEDALSGAPDPNAGRAD